MGPGLGAGKDAWCQHVVSFLVGAALPTALLVLLASDRLGDGLSTISSSWGPTPTITHELPAPAPAAGAPPAQGANSTPTASHGQQSEFAGLAELLRRVATDDGTVIITSVNEAFARPNSLFDVFRESFRAGEGIEHLLDHVLVVAVDDMAFAHCNAVHPHCYLLEVSSMNLSAANMFMSEAYVELVWTKLSLQQRVLELGYNFLFTDVDIVWLRNPFWHLSVFADMTTSSDVFLGDAGSRVLLREGDEPDGGDGAAVAGGAGEVPAEPRAGHLQRDQARARRRRPGRAHPVPRHGALRRLLPDLPRRHEHRVHHARQLLLRARQQAARPQGGARAVEELHRPDDAGEEEPKVLVGESNQVRYPGQKGWIDTSSVIEASCTCNR